MLHFGCFPPVDSRKVSVGIEVANQLAAALGKRLNELVRDAE